MAAHLYWRWSITSCDEGSGNKPPAIASLVPYDSGGSAIGTTGGSATASDVFSIGLYDANKAFDGNDSTYWASGINPSASIPQWLSYQFPSPVDIDHFTITNRPDSGGSYGPVNFTIQSSDDGGTWTNVWTYQGASGWDRGANVSRTFYTTGSVWRLLITATQGGTGDVTIADQKYFDSSSAQISTATGTALGSSAFSAGGDPANGFGNSCSSMWRSGYPLSTHTPAFFGFQFPTVVDVASFSFRSTTFAPSAGLSESPQLFALQKSLDGANFVTVQSFTAAPWLTNCQVQTFTPAVPVVPSTIPPSALVRNNIAWTQLRYGIDGRFGVGYYGASTDGSGSAGVIPVWGGLDGQTLTAGGGGGGSLTTTFLTTYVAGTPLLDSAGNPIFDANGNWIFPG